MLIVDAHLDLAYNALRGRDVLLPAVEQAADADGVPSVGLPDLHGGGAGLICATVFCEPSIDGKPGYTTPQEAFDAGMRQVAWYRAREAEGRFRFVHHRGDLDALAAGAKVTGVAENKGDVEVQPHPPLPAILLVEGADALRTPADVRVWFEAGMRILGMAWQRTRYAGGTRAPGPLTADGVALVPELDRFGIIHDASHLAEESFWQLLDLSAGPLIASHSNCRAIVPTDRQLSDEMINAIVKRGGVIGINFFDKFLLQPDAYGTRRARLADIVVHMRHICDLAGSARHVAIGTDMDGGFGQEEIPEELRTFADLPKLAEALAAAADFSDEDVAGIMGMNWVRFFHGSLPQ